MADVAAKTADALLTAMDTEEPFRLLRTLPGRLQELCLVERQRADSETRLAKDLSLIQSQNCDAICSAKSRVQDQTKRVKSISDAHIQHLQREADILQDSLDKLHNGNRPSALPRRRRVKGVSFKDVDNEISKLQDASVRTQDIAHHIRSVVEDLARDEVSLTALTERTLEEVGLASDNTGNRLRPGCCNPGGVENPLQTLIMEMEVRCKDVETSIALNNETINKQTEEIELLRRMANNPSVLPGPVNDDGGEGNEWDPASCFVLATIVAVMLAILVA